MTRRGRPPRAPQVDDGGSRTLSEEEEAQLAAEVAKAFYLEDRSKSEIAASFSISRFQVARLLRVAKARGIVTIQIHLEGGVDHDLGQRIKQLLGLRRVLIVTDASPVVDAIGRELARVLTDIVATDDVVGVTWSPAILAMSTSLRELKRCTVVQLAGHLSGDVGSPGAAEVARRIAEVASGVAYPIYAPLVVADSQAAVSLAGQPEIARVMAFFDRLSVAVVSIGAWRPGASLMFDSLPDDLRDRGTSAGAVGEIGGRLFDSAGAAIAGDIDDRVIGATLAQLAAVEDVAAGSFGAERAEATIAAARGGLYQTLVADRDLANAVIAALGAA